MRSVAKNIFCFTGLLLMLSNSNGQSPLSFSTTKQKAVTNTQQNVLVTNPKAIPSEPVSKPTSLITTNIKPYSKDGIFTAKNKKIGFDAILNNQSKQPVAGHLFLQIINSNGQVLYKENTPFNINRRGSFVKNIVFENGQLQPGFYTANMRTTSVGVDNTTNYSFGYEPNSIVTNNILPNDFINFWENAKRELAATAPNYSSTLRPDLSSKHNDVFEVKYNSINKAIISGFLSVPKKGSKNPILIKICDYLSELQPELRRDVAVFSVNVRGVGNSKTNYNLDYNSYGIYGLQDKNSYILKGIYLDAMRAIEFVTSYAPSIKVDADKIVITGTGLGATAATAAAALDGRAKALVVETPTFVSMKQLISIGESLSKPQWPVNMFQQFYNNRRNGASKESMLRTLAYFDGVNFAPFLGCKVLTGFSLSNTLTPSPLVYDFISQLRVEKKETHICKDCIQGMDKAFYGLKETWLKEIFKQP